MTKSNLVAVRVDEQQVERNRSNHVDDEPAPKIVCRDFTRMWNHL